MNDNYGNLSALRNHESMSLLYKHYAHVILTTLTLENSGNNCKGKIEDEITDHHAVDSAT